jgi:hypothetical protein
MPWFPDFVAAAELARHEIRAAGQADPVTQYLMALTKGDAHALETTWPGHIVVLDPYAGEVRGHRHLRRFVHTSQAFLAERLVDVERVASTSVGARAVVELLAHLKLDGEPVTWPVAGAAESTDDQSATFRTYGSQWPVVGRRPIRAPILDVDPSADPGDVVTRYLTALDAGDRDGVVQTFTTDGYLKEPIGPHAVHRGTDELALLLLPVLQRGRRHRHRPLLRHRRRCALRPGVQLRALGQPRSGRTGSGAPRSSRWVPVSSFPGSSRSSLASPVPPDRPPRAGSYPLLPGHTGYVTVAAPSFPSCALCYK